MTRRAFLHTAAFAAEASAQQRRPNVLMIALDDCNDWLGVLGGHPQVRTPHLDRLASRSVLFTDAHTAAPLCNPSRTALLTGLRPSTTGVYTNDQVWRTALPNTVTLPQMFRANGYHAWGGGKLFHHGRGYNDPRSWDDYFFWNPSARKNGWHDGYSFPPDPEPPGRPITPMPSVSWRNFDWAPLDVPDEEMPDFKLGTWAGPLLRQKHDRPFFLGAGIFRPHIPWFVPRKYFDLYPLDSVITPTVKENDLEDIPPIARQIALNPESRHDLVVSTGNWRKAVQAYLACISFADAMAGRILSALEEGPNRDNTIVVLWSDHGYHLGEKWHWHKQALWDRATHVPFMIAAPGVPAGRCSRPVGLIDIYPTLAGLTGLTPPAGLDGTSLVPLLRDPGSGWERPALATFLRGNHALRSERWSYIRYRDGSEELYDRRQDRNEWVNLAGRPESAPVKRELSAWLPRQDAPDVKPQQQFRFDPEKVQWFPK